jgi:hypothetical protein
MVLEGCESGDDLALESEGWDSIGDVFLGFRDFKDVWRRRWEGGPFRLLYLS